MFAMFEGITLGVVLFAVGVLANFHRHAKARRNPALSAVRCCDGYISGCHHHVSKRLGGLILRAL